MRSGLRDGLLQLSGLWEHEPGTSEFCVLPRGNRWWRQAKGQVKPDGIARNQMTPSTKSPALRGFLLQERRRRIRRLDARIHRLPQRRLKLPLAARERMPYFFRAAGSGLSAGLM